MRLLGVGLVLLSGCGLLLDLDPPEVDGGPRFDAGGVDGAPDVAPPDAFLDDGGVLDIRELDGGPDTGMCADGMIDYRARSGMCATRSLDHCSDNMWTEHKFKEIEICGAPDDDCDTNFDERLDIIECGVGECARMHFCGESCVDSRNDEVCSPVGEVLAFDEDCDGRVDEGCERGIACTRVIEEMEEFTITGPGDYCLNVDDCRETNVQFFVDGSGLSDVRIHGDMHTNVAGDFVPCSVTAEPRSRVILGRSLQIDGIVQATNLQLVAAVGLSAPAVVVGAGEFLGHHIDIRGGGNTAVIIDGEATARLSDARISSNRADGPTIYSEGRLVIEASCGGPLSADRCNDSAGGVGGGITKTVGGDSVIHLSGEDASLQLTAVRVVGVGSNAIRAENVGTIGVFDSAIIANDASLINGAYSAIELNECDGGHIRDSVVVNRGNTDRPGMSFGVRAQACAIHFSAANRPLATGQFHIFGGGGNTPEAYGVGCGNGCSFESISVAGFGPDAMPPPRASGAAVVCLGQCDVARSALEGNASRERIASATGLSLRGGTVLRSRLRGGDATDATGLVSTGGSFVHLQDSLVIGFEGSTGPALGTLEAQGVLLESGSNFSALHSTIAARSWIRRPVDSAFCHAIEAEADTQVRLVSTLLWTSCLGDDVHAYHGLDEAGIIFMDHVGVAEDSVSVVGGEFNTLELPFGFIPVSPETVLGADYSVGSLPVGAPAMVTVLDIDGTARSRPGSIGAFANP